MNNSIEIYIIFFSALAAFYSLYRKKTREIYLKIFPLFLLISFLVELAVYVMIEIGKSNGKSYAPTYLLYNPFTTLEFVFYFFIIREIIKKKAAKNILLGLMVAYPIMVIINMLFFQGMHKFHSFTYSIGCLLIVGCCIYYFYELFLMPHSVNLLRQPPFWICTALLFFYAFTYPIYGLSSLMSGFSNHLIIIIGRILDSLNFLLYSFFSIAFLCRLRIQK